MREAGRIANAGIISWTRRDPAEPGDRRAGGVVCVCVQSAVLRKSLMMGGCAMRRVCNVAIVIAFSSCLPLSWAGVMPLQPCPARFRCPCARPTCMVDKPAFPTIPPRSAARFHLCASLGGLFNDPGMVACNQVWGVKWRGVTSIGVRMTGSSSGQASSRCTSAEACSMAL